MALLDSIRSPADLRKLPVPKLAALADEIRGRIIEVVGQNGGHLASNLGVVETTIALHRCFNTPVDRLLFDVGHQCYPHKLLTGRARQFASIRKAGGLSGFPAVGESDYDLFNVGHAGTAIATAVGLARADQAARRACRAVALVGDASIVNGLAFEGLNQAGTLNRQFLVILNDNSWGIAPTQGALAKHLARFRGSPVYDELKRQIRETLPRVPLFGKAVSEALGHLKEGIKATLAPHQLFEHFGFQYVGPVDGHDIGQLIEMLDVVKDVQHPVLLHVHTEKGRGCEWALADPGTYHSPSPFTVEAGKVTLIKANGKSWTGAFADALVEQAEANDRIMALTAAMPDGTGLSRFAKRFPDRYLDVGIAESCTVDVAAGMARAGLRPVVAIYSTFLQRGFDQVFQEVVLQRLPVIFCMDRAGLVGGDGAVHHGAMDIAYLRGLAGMTLIAPADEPELRAALAFAVKQDRPVAIRYPRDVVPVDPPDAPPFELGVSRRMRSGDDATILAYGVTVAAAMEAAKLLAADGIDTTVVNARFAAPVDQRMIVAAFASGRPVVTVEDHSVAGGFGSAVLETAQETGLDIGPTARLGLPCDRFVAHGSRAGQMAEAGIDAAGIAAAVHRLVDESPGRESSARGRVGKAPRSQRSLLAP
ncbi:MAG: 1-deoxy-D-xylulose-5-phosphate synthase [Phycisphaerales bacterium]|nr:MAG: 1-deoxy-D-xylulose-5-phosphate synthase [Phycisphaerales bacterium]